MLNAQVSRKPTFVEARDIKLLCPECKIDPPDLVEEYSSGDLVCGQCGLVVGDKIVDTRSEWRTFANEDGDDPSRVGAATKPILDGLTENLETRISSRDGGSGVAMSLQRAQGRTAGNQNRHILDGFDLISNKVEMMHLGRATGEAAKQLFRRVHDEKILRGKSTEAIIAAVLLIACKQSGDPRSFPEIQKYTGVEKKAFAACFKDLQKTFDLGQESGGALNVTSAVHPRQSISATSSGSRISSFDLASDVAERVREKGILDGRSPVTVAAACIYLTTTIWGIDRSTKRISEATGVSPVTIKGSYRELLKDKEKILTQDLLKRSTRIDPNRAV